MCAMPMQVPEKYLLMAGMVKMAQFAFMLQSKVKQLVELKDVAIAMFLSFATAQAIFIAITWLVIGAMIELAC